MASMKGLEPLSSSGEPLGETWEVSVHPDGPSLFEGHSLVDLVDPSEMPYLIKLIDTSDYLSVQVHPDDEFAKIHENSQGKTECWIVLGAEDGAGIYLGMKPGVTKEEFEKALVAGEKMDQFLVFHEVKKGDFFYVPAGSIHAIGSGVFLAEVQQSSGITYRVWDWNRLDDQGNSRELHIEKAMQVIEFGDEFNNQKTFKTQKNIFTPGVSPVVSHPQFELSQVTLKSGEKIEITPKGKGRAVGLLNLDGKINIDGIEVNEYKALVRPASSGESIVIDAVSDGSLLLVE